MIPRSDEVWSSKPPLQVRYNRGLIPAKYFFQPHLWFVITSFVHAIHGSNPILQGSWRDYISFTLPYKTCMFSYIYIFLSFLRWDVSSHQTNMSMFIVNKLLSFFTSSLCWDPSSLHCLTHRRGSCPPCYRNWVPRSPSRLPLPLPSKCPCASGRQARMMGRYSPENEHVEPQ